MTEKNALNYHDVYPCPVCRHGEISTLPLMEAYACNFCQHIFTANLERQMLKMADSQLALSWYWNGRHWNGLRSEGTEMGALSLLAAVLFVLLPTAIVAISSYLFPPVAGSPLSWLPLFWSILTFAAHLICILWLILEYYQFPLNIYLGALRRHIWSSLSR
jgi:hypothetical protein